MFIEFRNPASLFLPWHSQNQTLFEALDFAVCSLMVRRTLCNQARAQANSRLRMARPRGITRMAGPGVTIITTPANKIVAPMTVIMILRANLYVTFMTRSITIFDPWPQTSLAAGLCSVAMHIGQPLWIKFSGLLIFSTLTVALAI